MELLDSSILELDDVDLEDSLESLASASSALNDDDSLLGGLAGLDDDFSSGDNLVFSLDESGETFVISNSDSLLTSEDDSLSSLDGSELNSESLDLSRVSASSDSVLNLGSLDDLLSNLISDSDLSLELSDLSSDLSGFSSDSDSFSS